MTQYRPSAWAEPPLTQPRLAAPRTLSRLLVVAGLLWGTAGCDQVQGIIDGLSGGGGVSEEVKQELKAGDFATAEKKLAEAVQADPTDIDSANHLAYAQMMKGKYDDAAATLDKALEAATDPDKPALHLRRAMVALRARDLDSVREHGVASGLPEGLLLAAEVEIQDLNDEEARKLLEQLQSNPGVVGATAKKYLELYNGSPEMNSLADVTALWALGLRKEACDNASQVIPDLPDDDKKQALMLLWAGRAVTSGQVEVASTLLAEMQPPTNPDQRWRYIATQAIVAVAEGRYSEGIAKLDALEGAAPADGLADARATAAAVSGDPEIAKQIVGDLESPAVAGGLQKAGVPEAGASAPAGSKIKDFME